MQIHAIYRNIKSYFFLPLHHNDVYFMVIRLFIPLEKYLGIIIVHKYNICNFNAKAKSTL